MSVFDDAFKFDPFLNMYKRQSRNTFLRLESLISLEEYELSGYEHEFYWCDDCIDIFTSRMIMDENDVK